MPLIPNPRRRMRQHTKKEPSLPLSLQLKLRTPIEGRKRLMSAMVLLKLMRPTRLTALMRSMRLMKLMRY